MSPTLISAVLLSLLGAPKPTSSLETRQLKAICKVADHLGRLDVLSHGTNGVALRIVTSEAARARAHLKRLFRRGRPKGIARITVETPRPMLGVVIDDIALRTKQLPGFWKLGQAITYAILPAQRHTKWYARWLSSRFASTIVHMPMEPMNPRKITFKGYLTLYQTATDRIRLFRKYIAEVRGAIGFNNHMGSRLTTHGKIMRDLVKTMPPGYVVLDSLTNVASKLAQAGTARGLPTATRTVFIDNVLTYPAIMERLEAGLATALVEGEAIVIGHPHAATVNALADFLTAHGNRVHIVPIERLTKPRAKPMWYRRCVWRKLLKPSPIKSR